MRLMMSCDFKEDRRTAVYTETNDRSARLTLLWQGFRTLAQGREWTNSYVKIEQSSLAASCGVVTLFGSYILWLHIALLVVMR
jgi:hypothetical protein